MNRWGKMAFFALLLFFNLQSFASMSPFSPSEPEDNLLFREGESLLSKGEIEKALWRFKKLTTDFPRSSLLNEAKFRMGLCYTRLKRPKDAIRIFNELLPTFLAPARMVQVFTLMGENYFELKDPLSALYWYGKGLLVPNQPHEELKKSIKIVIDAIDSEETLREIERVYRGAYAGGYAKLRLALLAKRRGDEPLVKRLIVEMEKEYQSMDYWPGTKQVAQPPRSVERARYLVGVILPLSGIYQTFGQKVLLGIQLALKEMESPNRPPLVSLVVRDSQGAATEAEKAVEDLASREKVIGIIGPLFSVTAEKAATRAELLRIPMITLCSRELTNGSADFVFQSSVTPSAQVKTLVAFAIEELELRTFAIFYPNSPYGRHFKNLFQQEVHGKGGRVVGSLAYQEDQTDFHQEIQVFFRMWGGERSAALHRSLRLDGLFIPDVYDRAGLILHQMAQYNLKGLTYLGTNGWNHPGLLSIAKKSAEGAFFVDAFSKTNPDPATDHFVRLFRKTHSRDPETLEALGYEAADLLREILRRGTVTSPLQLRDALRQVLNFEGLCGLNGFGERGEAIRKLSILRVRNGQIEHFAP